MRKTRKMILAAVAVFSSMCIPVGCGSGKPNGMDGQAETALVQPVEEEQAAEPDVGDSEKPGEKVAQSADGTEAETFCGNVERIDGDSVVCSRIDTYREEGSQGEVMVATAATEDKELVTVRFAQNAVYTYRIIRDGGTNVDTREGGFTDIGAGMILDLTGRYDGEAFLADTVMISDVRTD